MRIGGQNPSNNEDKCENEGTDKIHVQTTLVKIPTAEISGGRQSLVYVALAAIPRTANGRETTLVGD
jgi:hypothetical protein